MCAGQGLRRYSWQDPTSTAHYHVGEWSYKIHCDSPFFTFFAIIVSEMIGWSLKMLCVSTFLIFCYHVSEMVGWSFKMLCVSPFLMFFYHVSQLVQRRHHDGKGRKGRRF